MAWTTSPTPEPPAHDAPPSRALGPDGRGTAALVRLRRDDDPLAWLDDWGDDDPVPVGWDEPGRWGTEPTERTPPARAGRRPPVVHPDPPVLDAYTAELVADSLPFSAPAGYRRDRNGVWRYEWGRRVPSARDVTLERLVPARRCRDVVALETTRALEPVWELLDHTALHGWAFAHCTLWDAVRTRSLGIDAPELSLDRLVDTAGVAQVARTTPSTIRALVSRHLLPPPQRRVGRTPLWSLPVIEHWLATRPGQGARTDLRRKARR